MLMPQELKKHEFDYALRGYSTAEVDEYIQFICEKYEELYRENTELERKLMAALRLVDEVSRRNPSAAPASPDASLQAGRMLQEAERQKKRIVADAEEYADRIIADADAHVAKQAQVLESMKQEVLAFRDDLYARYSRQIDQIEELAASVQDNRINVPTPVRETLTDTPQAEPVPAEELVAAEPEPETEEEIITEPEAAEEAEEETAAEPEADAAEEAAQESELPEDVFPAEEAEEETEEEELLVFPLDPPEAEDPADDGVDEEELAATDEALAFFEDFDDDTPASGEESTEDEAAPEAEKAEEAEEEDFITVYGNEQPADATPEKDGAPTDPDEFDEYGDAVIPGGEPIGDDEDPLAGFDERIAALLGTMPPVEAEEENTLEDVFTEGFLQITEAEEEDADESEEEIAEEMAEQSDDELLRELRQAFHLQLEEFAKEDAAEKPDRDKEEFSFLPEDEEPGEDPPSLLERLTGRTNDTKKKDK